MLTKTVLRRAMRAEHERDGSTRVALEGLTSSWDSPYSSKQRERLQDLLSCLDRLQERVTHQAGLLASDLLPWLVEILNYLEHFDNYFGQGEHSEDRKRAVMLFCGYAQTTGLGVREFVRHVERLDPTRGRPEEEQVVMTTVFRTKGLEYDYVFIPSCEEGYMPCLFGTGNLVFDKAGIVEEPEPSEVIENERRLFYVAVTRAKKAAYIGASVPPVKGSQGKSSPSCPSRFLHEIQREPTVAVMTPLQRLAAGEKRAKDELRTSVARYGGAREIVQNLVTEYLPDIEEHSLAHEVERIAETAPPQAFAYPQTYDDSLSASTQETPPGWDVPEPPWWENDGDYP
jgi:superfamily I DNA/RNA helicase